MRSAATGPPPAAGRGARRPADRRVRGARGTAAPRRRAASTPVVPTTATVRTCSARRGQQPAGVLRDPLRQVQHERRRARPPAGSAAAGGRLEQVLLVGPRRGEAGPHGAVQADHLRRPRSGAGQRIEGGRRAVAQLPVGGHERRLGGRVLAHRREQAGVGRQLGPHRGGEHRGGHRAPAAGGERRGAEQLGQAVGGDEGDRGDADARPATGPSAAGGEQAAARHPDVVGRHHHGDRGQRIAALGLRDGAVQLDRRHVAVARPPHLDPHGHRGYEVPVTGRSGPVAGAPGGRTLVGVDHPEEPPS